MSGRAPSLLQPALDAAALRAWRLARMRASSQPWQWKQRAVAKRLGMSRRHYIRLEDGSSPIPAFVTQRVRRDVLARTASTSTTTPTPESRG